MAKESKKKKVQETEKTVKNESKVKNNKTNKKEKVNKNKKHFFKDFKAELKKVIWPTPKELTNNTIAVISLVIVTVVIVLVFDLCFELISKNGIEKLKKVVEESSSSQTTNQIDENVIDPNSVVDAVVENTVE